MKGVIYMTKSKRQRIREKTLKARIRTHNKRMVVWVGKIYWTKYKSGCEDFGQFYMSRLCPINGPVRNNGFEYKYPNRFRIRQYSATLKRSIPDLFQIPVSVAEQWKYSMPHLLDGMRRAEIKLFGKEIKE